MKKKILIAEDDKDIAEIIELYLLGEDYDVEICYNGLDALEAVNKEHYDLCILDVMMPKLDGYKLTKEIRKKFNMPIIIITAKIGDNDKILGLNIGADDYITKPFNPLEVVARVNANIRRCDKVSYEANSIKIRDLNLEVDNYRIFKNNEEIILTATEFKIISCMIKNPNRVFSREQISENILGKYCESDDHTITVHISNLRDKLGSDSSGKDYIKTVKGLGYKFEA